MSNEHGLTSHQVATAEQVASPVAGGMAFTFGEPTPVLDGRDILDYLECYANGRWYEPPVSLDNLAKAAKAGVYLPSGLGFKRNALSRTFIPHRLLSRAAFEQIVMDWGWSGNLYLEKRDNMLRQALGLLPCLSRYMRRGVDLETYYQVRGWKEEHEFKRASVCHLREADVSQEIYGLPEWLPTLQSALLNEAATLFRRKYFQNGSHAGFILYMTDPAFDENYVTDLRKAMRDSKGPGNFRNLFMYAPNGKKDGIQLIPISEVAAKDDFGAIKNISRDDQLAMLRIPPQLMGVVPQNAGGFGSVRDAAQVWAVNELEPVQARLMQINDWIGEEVVRFRPYEVPATSSK